MFFIFDKPILLRLDTEIPFFGAQTAAQRIHNVWFQFAETSVVARGWSRAQRHLEKIRRYLETVSFGAKEATIFSKRITAQRIPHRTQAEVAVSIGARNFDKRFKLAKR